MENRSGVTPVHYKIVVLPDEVSATTESGRIILTEDTVEVDQLAQEAGTLVAVSDMAFSDWKCRTPQVGERILFQRYAGRMIEGTDGKDYRVFRDEEVFAILGE